MFLKKLTAIAVCAVAFMLLPSSLSAGGGHSGKSSYNYDRDYSGKSCGKSHDKHSGKSCGKSHDKHSGKSCGKSHDKHSGKSCGKSHDKHSGKSCGKSHDKYSGKSCGKRHGNKACKTHKKGHCGKHHKKSYYCISKPPVQPPIATGSVSGIVYIDQNGNEAFNNGEGIENITVELSDISGNSLITTTDNDGNYYFSNVAEGRSTIQIIESTLPDNVTQVDGSNPSTVYIESNQDNYAGYDGYVTNEATGSVSGIVYIDQNGNEAFNNGEGIENITVELSDKNGNSVTTTTDNSGNYYFYNVLAGSATVKVIESTLPSNVTQVDGSNPSTVYIESNQNNYAGYDGYVTNEATGSVIGIVYIDQNGNETFNNGEGIENITVELSDKNGNSVTTTTDNSGNYYFYNVLAGSATVKVIESTLPSNVTQVDGSNPSTVYIESNQNNYAGYDGYNQPKPAGNDYQIGYDNGKSDACSNKSWNIISQYLGNTSYITGYDDGWESCNNNQPPPSNDTYVIGFNNGKADKLNGKTWNTLPQYQGDANYIEGYDAGWEGNYK